MRLPAFGRELLELRRAGKHPRDIRFVLGGDWGLPEEPHPMLALRPGEYRIGRLDTSVVAGCWVWVYMDKAADELLDGCPIWQWVCGELARDAVCVWAVRGWLGGRIEEIAVQCQRRGEPTPWWPPARARAYVERRLRGRAAA